MVYSGNVHPEGNTNSFLYIGGTHNWLMTPAYFLNSNAYTSLYTKNGTNSTSVSNGKWAVFPAISLKDNLIVSTGDGTNTNPYILQ